MDRDLAFDPRRMPDPKWSPPDITGAEENTPRIGWRSWQVSGELPPPGAMPRLYSVAGTHDYFWVPQRDSAAECNSRHPCNAEDGPGIPGESCHCGFYSAKTREHLLSLSYHTYDGERDGMYCVIGRVANWGKVIEGSLGWRAQFAYPVELFIPYEIWRLARPLEQAYRVKVRLDNFLKPVERQPL